MNNWLEDLKTLMLPKLSHGAHSTPTDGLCFMEMVAFIERLPHSDTPECTCPVIAAYARGVNDQLDNEARQELKPYLPRVVGTVSPEYESMRAMYLAQYVLRECIPERLRFHGFAKEALEVSSQDIKIDSGASIYAMLHILKPARKIPPIYDAFDMCYDILKGHYSKAAHRAVMIVSMSGNRGSFLNVFDGLLAIGPQGYWSNYSSERTLELLEYV